MIRFKFVERPVHHQVYGPLHFSGDLQESDFGLPPVQLEKTWWAGGPNVCEFCDDLDGLTIPIEDDFDTIEGALSGPPLHPNCNCDIEMVTPDDSSIEYEQSNTNFGDNVGDESRATAISDQLDSLHESMPSLIDVLPPVQDGDIGLGVLAQASRSSGLIVVNSALLNMDEAAFTELFKDNKGWLSVPSLEGVLTHEVGHFMLDKIQAQGAGLIFHNDVPTSETEVAMRKANSDINKAIAKQLKSDGFVSVSGYAADSPTTPTGKNEPFAEAFSKIYTSGDPEINAATHPFTADVYAAIKGVVK